MKDLKTKTERRNCGGLVKPKLANSLSLGQAFNSASLQTPGGMGAPSNQSLACMRVGSKTKTQGRRSETPCGEYLT